MESTELGKKLYMRELYQLTVCGKWKGSFWVTEGPFQGLMFTPWRVSRVPRVREVRVPRLKMPKVHLRIGYKVALWGESTSGKTRDGGSLGRSMRGKGVRVDNQTLPHDG